MKKKEIGIGLCGYGAMGRTHAYALAALPYYYDVLPFSARIVAVHTAHAASVQAAAQALSCRAAATLEELLCDPAVDVVDICTPNHTHFSVAKEALAAKKAIYMEKPLCVGAAQARELAALATQSGACTQVVFNNRYLSAVLRAKELIGGAGSGGCFLFILHIAIKAPSTRAAPPPGSRMRHAAAACCAISARIFWTFAWLYAAPSRVRRTAALTYAAAGRSAARHILMRRGALGKQMPTKRFTAFCALQTGRAAP